MKYKLGTMAEDSIAHRGWFIGTFMDDSAAKTDAVEVKYWEFPTGPTNHHAKTSATYECTIIIAGSCKGVVDGQEIELRAGQYCAIPPHVPSNIPTEATEPVTGITIKAPSDPAAKRVLAS